MNPHDQYYCYNCHSLISLKDKEEHVKKGHDVSNVVGRAVMKATYELLQQEQHRLLKAIEIEQEIRNMAENRLRDLGYQLWEIGNQIEILFPDKVINL